MVLLELLKLQERRIEAHQEFLEFLYEHLGNLNVIDKSLIKILRKQMADTYYVSPGSKPNQEQFKIGKYLGTNSTVDEEPARNPSQVMKAIMDAESKVIAVVIKYGDKQVCAFASRHKTFGKRGHKDTDDDLHIIVSPDFFNIVGSGADYTKSITKQKMVADHRNGSIKKPVNVVDGHTVKHLLQGHGAQTKSFDDVALNSANVKKVLAFIFDNAKANNMQVSMLNISKDEQRPKTQVDRSNARHGRIPFMVQKSLKSYSQEEKQEYERYTQRLISKFADRLSNWRSEKADKQSQKFSNHDELIKHISAEGFPEKVNFMGYVYHKERVSIEWNDLEAKANKTLTGYKAANPRSVYDNVLYKIDRKAPSFIALRNQMRELAGGIPEQDDSDPHVAEARDQFIAAYMRKYKKLVPPGDFMVHMSLIGGVIKPTDISISEDNDYVETY